MNLQRAKIGIRVSEVQTVDRLQMSCEHVSLELRPKTSETFSGAYKATESA